MEQIVSWIVEKIGQLGYGGIIGLMFLESSFFPFPSEVVMPPAGYLASQGKMSLSLSIISGIVGSILGALFNYYLAVKWGRAVLLRYGKYILISESSLLKAENFFNRHGHISTFIGRLLPGIRQYISLPAGLLRMGIPKFIFYTSLGSGIWVTILAAIGFLFGENQELVKKYLNSTTALLILFCVVLTGSYIIFQKAKNKKLNS
ncbi:MAG: DedA family protein [candidate division WOR-3 bacterium]